MSPRRAHPRKSEFTRGEKCIFVHLIITFVIIIALIIVYFIHLCFVSHTRNDVFKISRRTHGKGHDILDHYAFGFVYINITTQRIICNILLLKPYWSIGPAQCTAMRSDPDMSQFLFLWKIKYTNSDGNSFETDVKRTLTHSHFNRDDYNNNIGLFEHQEIINLKEYVDVLQNVALYHPAPTVAWSAWSFTAGTIPRVLRHIFGIQGPMLIKLKCDPLENVPFPTK